MISTGAKRNGEIRIPTGHNGSFGSLRSLKMTVAIPRNSACIPLAVNRCQTAEISKSLQEITLDKPALLCYNTPALKRCATYRGIEQLEARRAHNPEVGGSSPPPATINSTGFRKKSGAFLTFEVKWTIKKYGWS